MTLVAILVLIVILVLAIPVAAGLGWLGLVLNQLYSPISLIVTTGEVTWSTTTSFILVAVPFYVLMGEIMLRTGMAERMYAAIAQWVSWLPGGLMHSNVVACAVWGAPSGSSVATAVTVGTVAMGEIKKHKYTEPLFLGTIAAGGTLGILIPPSVMLIVMGPVVGVPTTDLFAAAVVPGLLLSGLYIVYTLARSYINPELGPPLPMDERRPFGYVLKELILGIAPIVIVIMATLGVILAGIATPTDAGAVGAFAVLLLTMVYRRMTWQKLKKAVYSTLEVSCMILLLVAASNFFGAVFSRLGSATLIAESLLTLNFSPTIMLLLILAIIFVLGWPLEWVPIVLIVVPILLPLVQKLGIDLVWFCTLVAVCLQTAWLSPPVALSAYFLKGVVPDWELKDIYAGMMQFMALQIIGLLLILFFPQLALWLPTLLRD